MSQDDAIHNISQWGVHKEPERRREILVDEIRVPLNQPADYAVLSGCLPPFNAPDIFHSLKHILEHFGVTYTFLSKEYCCGFLPLLQPAIIAKDHARIERLKPVTENFMWKNIEQAKALGCKGLVTVCAPCEANYSNIKHEAGIDIYHYHGFLASLFEGGRLDRSADYYAGCVKFRRGISNVSFNSEPIRSILSKIAGLYVNTIDRKLCCFVPSQMEKIVESITTNYVITSCTGCRDKLAKEVKVKKGVDVRFLTEVMWESLRNS